MADRRAPRRPSFMSSHSSNPRSNKKDKDESQPEQSDHGKRFASVSRLVKSFSRTKLTEPSSSSSSSKPVEESAAQTPMAPPPMAPPPSKGTRNFSRKLQHVEAMRSSPHPTKGILPRSSTWSNLPQPSPRKASSSKLTSATSSASLITPGFTASAKKRTSWRPPLTGFSFGTEPAETTAEEAVNYSFGPEKGESSKAGGSTQDTPVQPRRRRTSRIPTPKHWASQAPKDPSSSVTPKKAQGAVASVEEGVKASTEAGIRAGIKAGKAKAKVPPSPQQETDNSGSSWEVVGSADESVPDNPEFDIPDPRETDILGVYDAMPAMYWAGRFSSMMDRLSNEEAGSITPSNMRAKEQARMAKVLETLATYCRTDEALDSLIASEVASRTLLYANENDDDE